MIIIGVIMILVGAQAISVFGLGLQPVIMMALGAAVIWGRFAIEKR